MKRELTAFLGQNGFQEIGTNFPDVSFFIRRENTFVLCLYVVEATRDMPLSAAQLEELGKGIDAYLKTKALPEAHTLELLLSDSLPHADFLRGNRFRSWLVDTTSGKLYLPAGEDDFYGCRADHPHCITQITPLDMFRAYNLLLERIAAKNSEPLIVGSN